MKKQSQFTQRTDVLDTDKMPGRRLGVPPSEANSEWSMAALRAYFGGLSDADLAQLQQDIAAARQRANHLGTQPATTITGLSAVATSGSYNDLLDKPAAVTPYTDAQADSRADGRIAAQKGQPNGLASLDSGGKVPAIQLPSYVDDVLEYSTAANFPATGETGKIYVATDANAQYRWSGSAYVQMVASPGSTDAVPEGSVNKYFTETRAATAARTAGVGDAADWVAGPQRKGQLSVSAGRVWRAKNAIGNSTTAPESNPSNYAPVADLTADQLASFPEGASAADKLVLFSQLGAGVTFVRFVGPTVNSNVLIGDPSAGCDIAGGTSGLIIGGRYCYINGGDQNNINGGQSNTIVAGDYNRIDGGDNHVIYGGQRNIISGGTSCEIPDTCSDVHLINCSSFTAPAGTSGVTYIDNQPIGTNPSGPSDPAQDIYAVSAELRNAVVALAYTNRIAASAPTGSAYGLRFVNETTGIIYECMPIPGANTAMGWVKNG